MYNGVLVSGSGCIIMPSGEEQIDEKGVPDWK